MNPTLKQIHDMLLAQHMALAHALDDASDPDNAKAILLEMQEVLHRINLTENLLFAEESKELDAMLPAIKQANDALTASLQNIANVASFLASVSNFLKGVDQAIDLAKTLTM